MTIAKARKLLGDSAVSMSDSDVEDLLSSLYSLAEIVTGLVDPGGSNRQLGVIDSVGGNSDNGYRS